MSEILVKLEASPVRRVFGTAMLVGLGAVILYISAVSPPSNIFAIALLIAISAGFFWAGKRLYEVTADAIILTREDITTASGRLLCRIDEIDKVDKGFFAFKPTNGFLILLKAPSDRSWAPGLWWHLGKRIGIGGVTSPRQAKEMAAIISMMLIEQSNDNQ